MAIIVTKTFTNGLGWQCKTIASDNADKQLLEVATGARYDEADVLASVNNNAFQEVDKITAVIEGEQNAEN